MRSKRRSILLRASAVVVLVSILAAGTVYGRDAAVPSGRASMSPGQIAKARKSILVYTNRERARRGLPPLRSSAALNYLAQAQSANMCAALTAVNRDRTRNKCSLSNFNHESDLFPEGWQRFGERLRKADLYSGAENIACRTLEPDLDRWARTIVLGWMNSKQGHHKKNILNRRHRFLGVGVVGCLERIGYATQVFSDRSGRILSDLSRRSRRRVTGINHPVFATVPAHK